MTDPSPRETAARAAAGEITPRVLTVYIDHQQPVAMHVCALCGVVVWNVTAHYAHAHSVTWEPTHD